MMSVQFKPFEAHSSGTAVFVKPSHMGSSACSALGERLVTEFLLLASQERSARCQGLVPCAPGVCMGAGSTGAQLLLTGHAGRWCPQSLAAGAAPGVSG